MARREGPNMSLVLKSLSVEMYEGANVETAG